MIGFVALAFGQVAQSPATAGDLGLPVDCTPGETCFVQQYPDMQPGAGVLDPFCGAATYDDHDGLDIRVLSLVEMRKGVAVTAVADGTVLRGRDGVADSLVETDADRQAVKDHECGNGLVIDHGGGLQAQYCHLRKGSVSVRPGDTVAKGQPVGLIGASGQAEFPHVHVTFRRQGKVVEPATGLALGAGCIADPQARKPLWDAAALDWLDKADTHFLAIGLAGGALDYASLVVDGPPAPPTSGDVALVGWGWFANLEPGDRIRIRVLGPSGGVIIDSTDRPLDRAKAAYSAFAGRKGTPPPGDYRLLVELMRGGKAFDRREKTVTIR